MRCRNARRRSASGWPSARRPRTFCRSCSPTLDSARGRAIAGVAGAAALSQFLRGILYGISNLDPLAYLAAIAVFIVTVAVAALCRPGAHCEWIRSGHFGMNNPQK